MNSFASSWQSFRDYFRKQQQPKFQQEVQPLSLMIPDNLPVSKRVPTVGIVGLDITCPRTRSCGNFVQLNEACRPENYTSAWYAREHKAVQDHFAQLCQDLVFFNVKQQDPAHFFECLQSLFELVEHATIACAQSNNNRISKYWFVSPYTVAYFLFIQDVTITPDLLYFALCNYKTVTSIPIAVQIIFTMLLAGGELNRADVIGNSAMVRYMQDCKKIPQNLLPMGFPLIFIAFMEKMGPFIVPQ